MHHAPLITAVAAALLAAPTFANANPADPAPVSEPRPAYAPQWTDPDIADVAEHLTGSWISAAGVNDLAGQSSRYVMNIAAVPVEGVPNTLYVESAREGSLADPFRHALYELVAVDGAVRLRTLELRLPEQARAMLTGLWAAPEWFPTISADDVIVSSEIVLRRAGSGWKGSTAHPFPTRLGGAIEMTTTLELAAGSIVATDTGFGPGGATVWGGEPVVFERSEGGPEVTRRDDGMIVIEYANPGEPVADLDRIHARYTGWLESTRVFDSNRDPGRDAFIFAYPPGARAITGWGIGMEGVSPGTRRKLIIPAPIAYAERGNPRAGIGPDQPLYFDVEILHIDRHVPPEEPATPEGTPDDHSGHDHGED